MTHRRPSPRAASRPRTAGLVVAAGLLACAPTALAQRILPADEMPREYEGVTIVEKLDEAVPLDLPFRDETGATVQLGDYFAEGVPVILTLNYYRCPQLCTLTLNGLVDALNDIDWSAGEEFRIVTVSIAPEEGPELAEVKKRAYLTQYDRAGAAEGWSFLVGGPKAIEALAEATGFGYRRDAATGEYIHSSSIMFLTPEGRLSRYMNDVSFQPKDVRLALVEASQGAIGTPMERFLLFTCFQYDPERGSYTASVRKLMKTGGIVTIAGILVAILVLGRLGPKRALGFPGRVALGGLKS